jgi:hypothetical protein
MALYDELDRLKQSIRNDLEQGTLSHREISEKYEIPYGWVVTVLERMAREELKRDQVLKKQLPGSRT